VGGASDHGNPGRCAVLPEIEKVTETLLRLGAGQEWVSSVQRDIETTRRCVGMVIGGGVITLILIILLLLWLF